MVRRLLWLGVGFCAGAGLVCYVLSLPLAAALAGGCLLCAAGAAFLLRARARARGLALLLGLAVGLGYTAAYGAWAAGPARAVDGQTFWIQGRALDYSQESRVLTAFSLDGREVKGWLYYDEDLSFEPGDALTVEVWVEDSRVVSAEIAWQGRRQMTLRIEDFSIV